MKTTAKKRRICFVTGSRAEFGLMQSTLRAIQSHPQLHLRIIATGMHLNPAHGKPLSAIRQAGFKADGVVNWGREPNTDVFKTSIATGMASAAMTIYFQKLKSDIVLVVGDRVEAFAAASAAHICQIPIAHIHGGDRALGQIDDSLRHAISKLSHIHFPATRQSAKRLAKMGEDQFRIHFVGSPAIDNIERLPAPWSRLKKRIPTLRRGRFALLVLHPVSANPLFESRLATSTLKELVGAGFNPTVVVYPNNDPGSAGIALAWELLEKRGRESKRIRDSLIFFRDLPRCDYLGLLKHAAVLIGNSSSGIIEAASFGTPVINIGDRQKGRQRNHNVIDVSADPAAIRRALKKVWNNGHPIRFPRKNIYGSGRTSQKIAHLLATIPLDGRLRRKLIAY